MEFKILHLFSGIGGAAIGFQQAQEEYRGLKGKFRTLAGIDCDPDVCRDFAELTGAPGIQMDLFAREDYTAFHGHEPPLGRREVGPEELREAIGERPDVVFTSPPCKGFSGLLPSDRAKSAKYQALNNLTVRGIWLTLEAWKDDLPGIIMLENVPRITSRGEKLLKTIKGLLQSYGYASHDASHDCGEIGGLGQRRKRYVLISRQPDKIKPFVYQPPMRRVRSIGEIICPLPMPDDPAAGPMHRMPNLQFKTWVRLALIREGGDWRDLENVDYENLRLQYMPRSGAMKVQAWDEPSSTVTGGAGFGRSNGSAAVADPRINCQSRPNLYGVAEWNKPTSTVTGSAKVTSSNGVAAVADPRLKDRDSRHPAVYQVVRWDEAGPTVTGTRFGSGAPAIADPRTGFRDSTHHAIYRVSSWEEAANTVTGANRPNNGSISIADPRLSCNPRSGSYGVQDWDQPGKTVIGAGDIHAGAAAIADPRMPADNESGTWVIIALDGTWHRPLTTLELAALQSFPLTMPDGRPLQLSGKSDAKWREWIGNAVPPRAAKAMGSSILIALLANAKGEEFMLSSTDIWVEQKEGVFNYA